MKNADRAIASELKKRLCGEFRILRFLVFGSRARGEGTDESDMDIFIETDIVNKQTLNRIRTIAWEVGLPHLIHISPLVYSRKEIEKSPHRSSPVVQNILAEGITV